MPDPYSQYYAQFLEVYAKNKVLTQEEKEMALFWGDDPSRTFTPPGHSYSIARIGRKNRQTNPYQSCTDLCNGWNVNS